MNKKIRGLYAITPEESSTERLLEKVREALEGGARILQYRNKESDQVYRLWQADALASLARAREAIFIVNDSIELALATRADGVHLGKEDGSVAAARKALPDKIIGVSCYNDLNRAIEAQEEGADYVAFGSAFLSSTKPDAVHASFALYQNAIHRLSIPVVAIGGITMENAKKLVTSGVDAIAVISGLFDTDNVRFAAEYFSGLFHKKLNSDNRRGAR
jgi:thiamine-phosphate pyrophosphorylase